MVPMVKLLAGATIREQFRLWPWQLHLGAPRRRVGNVTGSEPQSQAPPVPGSYFTLARDQWPLSIQSGGNTPTMYTAAHSTTASGQLLLLSTYCVVTWRIS